MSKKIDEINVKNHHVIGTFSWPNIPMLSVITGVNGSGKTKFLELMYSGIMGHKVYDPKTGIQMAPAISFNNKPGEYEFFYVGARSGVNGLGRVEMSTLQAELDAFVQTALSGGIAEHNGNHWRVLQAIKRKTRIDVREQSRSYFDGDDFRRDFLDGWTYLNDVGANQHISRLFLNYYIKMSDTISARRTPDGRTINDADLKELVGEAPWTLINELFEKYNFQYRINQPLSIASNLVIKFRSVQEGFEILYEELSSGEQMIVNLVLWSFNSDLAEHRKLILLDEPDAHLHPEMGLMFKEIVTDILVHKLGIQVILTTHSPTTLCWFDESSIFLFEKKIGVIKSSKEEALQRLTSGMVMIHEAFKIVLVEDEMDQSFYQRAFDLLILNRGIERHKKLLFRSVTKGMVSSGGRSNVVSSCNNWQDTTKIAPEITDMVAGLVDHDGKDGSDLGDLVFSLPRYCLENFFADPLLIFALMVDNGDQTVSEFAASLDYRKGDQYLLKTNRVSNPQKIVDFMCGLLGTKIKSEELISVTYANNISVKIPDAFFKMSGKDYLLKMWREVLPEKASLISTKALMPELERTLLIPRDLHDIFTRIQNM